jgi:Domain of unknown function (DUF4249)
MKKIILFISFFILFLACREKEIEYELPFEGEKLVVIGVLNPDESFNVKVSHTWTPTGIVPKNTFVNDATVIVLENGKLREQLMLDKEGKYVSSKGLKPLLGQKYSVEVSSSKYAKVISEQVQIPENKAKFTYQQVADIDYKYNRDTPKDQINVIIEDDISKRSYFAISFNLYGDISSDGNLYNRVSAFYLNDDGEFSQNKECSFAQSIYQNNTSEGVRVFANQCFTNSKNTFNFVVEKAYYNSFQNNKPVFKKIDKPTLNVYQFDKGYFEYLKLKDQPDGLFERAFTEPHTTYTNIKGGYGIIGAITKKSELLNMTCKICQ